MEGFYIDYVQGTDNDVQNLIDFVDHVIGCTDLDEVYYAADNKMRNIMKVLLKDKFQKGG